MSLKVMLVDNESVRSAILAQALNDNGYEVIARVKPGPGLLAQVALHLPDMIVVDTDSPDRDILESMHLLSEHNPLPVVMFADEENETIIQEAIRSGVSSYVVKGVDMERVNSIMSVSIARFREYQAIKKELKETKSELVDTKLIDKAKRLLMKNKGVDEDQAYEAMRKLSMDANQKMSQVAQNIVNVYEL
ncbi:ANTAR domain-containing response regulator [Thiomicrorhabdus sp.]|uniref:ANTAR domain-containing response regulator n=1 Tax=Thiomicrorhabdus sp. TaxID=2039724 RepID=UPI002AA7DD36|nr:ANTAR domain-containing protein [Thiomicrorhabdus sp.]